MGGHRAPIISLFIVGRPGSTRYGPRWEPQGWFAPPPHDLARCEIDHPPTQHYHYLDAFRRGRGNCKLISGVAQGGRSWVRAVRHVKSSEGIKLVILLLRTELLLVSRSKVRVAFAQLVNGPEDRLPKLGLMRLAVL
jgi:hypothetical protein